MIRALIPCPLRMLAVVLRHTCEVTQSKPAFVLASANQLGKTASRAVQLRESGAEALILRGNTRLG